MHRFAVDFFPNPVAVNDLGYVSYRNDAHVLDLWGLGSEDARQMNADGGRTAEAVDRLTIAAGSAYAMIYDSWFEGDIPPTWCLMATLKTPKVSAASDEVQFYLIDRTRHDEMGRALTQFGTTLPTVSSLTLHSCGAGQD